jgi:hypothetical protein
MSYADPQSVTFPAPIAGTISLPRVSVGQYQSSYQSGDGLVKLTASSQIGKRTRRVLRLDHSKISADVFLPATNVEQSMSCYMVFDIPAVGYSVAEQTAVYTGLKDSFVASSNLLITKLLGGES